MSPVARRRILIGLAAAVLIGFAATHLFPSSAAPDSTAPSNPRAPSSSPAVSEDASRPTGASRGVDSEATGAGGDTQHKVLSPRLDPETLAQNAQFDAEARRQLSSMLSLCSTALASDNARLQERAWRDFLQGCSKDSFAAMMEALRRAPRPSSAEWQALEHAVALASDDADVLAERDRALLDALHTSNDPDVVGLAAYHYFELDRVRAWAQGEIPESMAGPGGIEGFRSDLAQMLACNAGQDCSPRSASTLALCANTAMCMPGLTLEQVIALRRSPQELALLRAYVQRMIAQRSPQGG